MKKYPTLILVVFIVLTSFCVSTYADIITLKNANQDVELKVLGIADEHITAAIPSKAIKTLVKQFSDIKSYPDVLFMISPGVTVVCRVKEVTEDTVQILIPTSMISSLKMGFQPSVKPETDASSSRISDKPKEVVGDVKAFPREKTGAEKNSRLPVAMDSKLGNVQGKIFQNGKPLKNCQVKLVVMEKVGFLTKEYHTVEGASEIESVTDDHGVYHFANIPPGRYKMYWLPPSETGWVRRLKMDPDVVVESGKLVTPKDIETTKRTLN